MNNKIQERFNALLGHNVLEDGSPPVLTDALARQLLERLAQLRLFAHAYPLLTNLTHGRVTPADLLDFAYRHELCGQSGGVHQPGAQAADTGIPGRRGRGGGVVGLQAHGI